MRVQYLRVPGKWSLRVLVQIFLKSERHIYI